MRSALLITCLLASAASAHDFDVDGGSAPDAGLEGPSDAFEDAGAAVEPDAGAPLGSTRVVGARDPLTASETVVARDVISAAPKTGAVDLLRLVPGLVASQHSGEGKAHQLFLRGFDAVHGQDIELNVAGLPVNAVSHIHALGYADLNWLFAEAVREVKVYEGTHRAFQGDFATAGTVRFELGLEEQGVVAKGTLGTFGTRRALLGVRPFEDPATFAAVEVFSTDGFGPQRSAARVSLLGQLLQPLGSALKLRAVVGSYFSRYDSPGVVRADAYAAGTTDFFEATAPQQGGSSSRHQALVGLELPGETGATKLELFFIRLDDRLRNNFTGFVQSPSGDGLEQTHGVTTVGVRLEHRRRFTLAGAPLALEASLGGRRDAADQAQRRYRDADGVGFDDSVDARFAQSALFAWAEAIYRPGAWRLLLGGRLDALGFEVFDAILDGKRDYNGGTGFARTAFGLHPAVKVGVARSFGEHLELNLNYGDGFRSPQARSLSQGERAPFVSVRGGELGLQARFERLLVQAVGFGSWVQDDLFFDHTSGTTVSAGTSLRAGGALVVVARPLRDLVLSASTTLATATLLKDGTRLPYFAPLVARVDASYGNHFHLGRELLTWKLGAAFTGIGPRPLRFDDVSFGVALLDASASLRWRWVGLRVDCTNLLGTLWRDGEFTYASNFAAPGQVSLLPARHFSAGSPRQLFVSLEVHL